MLKELYQKRLLNSSRYGPNPIVKGNFARLTETGVVL